MKDRLLKILGTTVGVVFGTLFLLFIVGEIISIFAETTEPSNWFYGIVVIVIYLIAIRGWIKEKKDKN